MNIGSFSFFKTFAGQVRVKLERILTDSENDLYPVILQDLKNIESDIVDAFCLEYHIDRYITRQTDKDLARRTWCLAWLISDQLTHERNQELMKPWKEERTSPYDEAALIDVPVNENNLVSAKSFLPYGLGFLKDDMVFQICPILESFNASYSLTELIRQETFRNGRDFYIRLDPLLIIPKNQFDPPFQFMEVYGQRLDWERLKLLEKDDYGQWFGDDLSSKSIHFTDYVWSPKKNQIHFTCEELPKESEIASRGSRYFHAIFDKASGQIIHCDGALRFYDSDEYNYRIQYHIKHPDVTKIGKRIKIFQIDEAIDQQLFLDLAVNFLVWNQDAMDYFS